jgi:luciferase family oxidoreductase group 1
MVGFAQPARVRVFNCMFKSRMPTRLSILDQSPVITGYQARDAIAATVDLAQMADSLGYSRYWCAEHHGLRGVCNPCPEVLLARLGSVTRRIRLGSGGVMLPYYSPFKVAEQFRMLEALFPGRIDLGVGRAPGGDQRTAQLVAWGQYDPELFPAQVMDLISLTRGPLPDGHEATGVPLQPVVDTAPEIWMLGSSGFGGALAAHVGIRFAFAHFINAHGGDQVARAYRQQFRPGADAEPYCAVAVFAICADTEAEAADYAKAVDLRRVEMAYGVNAPIPSLEQAARWEPDDQARQIALAERPRSIIGTPQAVAAQMRQLQERYQADELIVLSVAPSYAARMRTYELLAQAFELPA